MTTTTTESAELLALADEIESSDGLYRLDSKLGEHQGYQLGIKKTAQVVAALRLAAKPAEEEKFAEVQKAADDVVSRIGEWDDRTSSDEFPEALLITPSNSRAGPEGKSRNALGKTMSRMLYCTGSKMRLHRRYHCGLQRDRHPYR